MIQPASDGLTLFYTSVTLMTITLIVFGMRVCVRVWRSAFGLDDTLMAFGVVGHVIFTVLTIICCFYGAGQKAVMLTPDLIMTGTRIFFVAEFFYAAGCALIKASVAVTLLRISSQRRRFTWTIWLVMGLTFAATIIFCVCVANICHPINKLWNTSLEGECNLTLDTDVSIFYSAVEILTDFVLAVLPGFILWNIQMKPRLKIMVAAILGMATFASVATIIRLGFLNLYSDPTEFMFGVGKIGLWSVVEEAVGVTSASIPALKPLLTLKMFNLSSTDPQSKTGLKSTRIKTQRVRRDHYNLDTFQELGDRDTHDNDDGDSQKQIVVKDSQITVTTHHTVVTDDKPCTRAGWERHQALGWQSGAEGMASKKCPNGRNSDV